MLVTIQRGLHAKGDANNIHINTHTRYTMHKIYVKLCEWISGAKCHFSMRQLGTTDSKRWRQRQAERWRCGDGNTGCLIDNSIDKYESAGLLKAEEMEKMVACD
ncbi:unnamed protein product [Ceratitis capitata]|uniref:(Mediterranean fruit fly) hypothetical protein n=1 Tax=Ceratitis capitata TaxID=7213 RepID=A0A811VBD3_CERCA|nr:unnamed protein product [Ceratitis capitata]